MRKLFIVILPIVASLNLYSWDNPGREADYILNNHPAIF